MSGLAGLSVRGRVHRTSRTDRAGAVLCALLVAGGFALGPSVSNLHNGLIAASFTAVGLVVLRERPGHREARLFVATGLVHAVMFFARQYGLEAQALPGQRQIAWAGVWPLGIAQALAGVTLMSFPTGRPHTRAWRVVAVLILVAGASLCAVSASWPVGYESTGVDVAPLVELPGTTAVQVAFDLARTIVFPLSQLAWVVCLVDRLRRSSGQERVALSWFVYAVVASAAVMAAGLLLLDTHVVGVLAVPLLPVVAGVVIVRHHLYDIDVVVNKTLVVGTMAVAITAGYVVVVVGVGQLAGRPIGTAIDSGPVLPLVATALVAVAFEPVRRRVQQAADRLVYGARPTPYEALARLSTQLGDAGKDDLFAGLATTVAEGVGAARATLWVGGADDLVAVAAWPEGEPLPAAQHTLSTLADDARSHVRPIVHGGVVRGAITLVKAPGEALTTRDDRLLADLVAQAGLVIDHRDLGVDLQRRLQQVAAQAGELRSAAKRVVSAQDDARRRLERDLHDGAQQRLVTLALGLRSAQEQAAATGDADLAERLGRVRAELAEAIDDLRELARGIHPAILTQDGLVAALSFLAERSAVPVRVEVALDRRLPADVEATAYFVVAEALTNAARHAQATAVSVSGNVGAGVLGLEIRDDGRGGADLARGSGLQGVADRLAALGGRLVVDSPAGGGTVLRAEIPCA